MPTPPGALPPSRAARRSRRAPPGATRAAEPTESAHPPRVSAGAGRGSSGDNRRPMNALFEDGGKFHAGRVMSETDASLQIELASGKRSKVKAANVLLRFAAPEPEALLGAAERIAREIDLDLAW